MCFLFGVIVICMSGPAVISTSHLLLTGERMQVTITHVAKKSGRGASVNYLPTFSMSIDGERHDYTGNAAVSDKPQVGRSVAGRYHAKTGRIGSDAMLWSDLVASGACLTIGLFLFWIGALMLVSQRQSVTDKVNKVQEG